MSDLRPSSLLSKEAEALLQSDIRTGTRKLFKSRFAQTFSTVQLMVIVMQYLDTKAVFNVNHPLPRYSAVWDVDILVSYLETMHPPESLSLFDFGAKTTYVFNIFIFYL